MVVEQRIGRIDRIGQESDRLLIFNLVMKDTVENGVYTGPAAELRSTQSSRVRYFAQTKYKDRPSS